MREIKFNLGLPIAGFNRAKAWAERAEALGFYSVSVADHMFTRTNFPELREHPGPAANRMLHDAGGGRGPDPARAPGLLHFADEVSPSAAARQDVVHHRSD